MLLLQTSSIFRIIKSIDSLRKNVFIYFFADNSNILFFSLIVSKRNQLLIISSTLKKQNGHLSQVKINEMFRLVCHIRTKVTANDAMPSGIVLLVKFFLNEGGNILQFIFALRKARLRNELEYKKNKIAKNICHALAFSMLNLFNASEAQSTASCCISSDMSAFLMTAFRGSDMLR